MKKNSLKPFRFLQGVRGYTPERAAFPSAESRSQRMAELDVIAEKRRRLGREGRIFGPLKNILNLRVRNRPELVLYGQFP